MSGHDWPRDDLENIAADYDTCCEQIEPKQTCMYGRGAPFRESDLHEKESLDPERLRYRTAYRIPHTAVRSYLCLSEHAACLSETAR